MKRLSLVVRLNWVTALVLALTTYPFESPAADIVLPRGMFNTMRNPAYAHIHITEELRDEDFSALAKVQALWNLSFDGKAATDERLKTLAQLRFTNLVCVIFTDCPLVTDKGIEHLAPMPTLKTLGLRKMAVTDAACETMLKKMRLRGVNMRNCTNATANGLLKMAKSDLMEDFTFSVGQMTQEDVLRLITTSGPKMKHMEIEMSPAEEKRLDFPALREAAKAKKIMLLALRGNHATKL